MDWGGFGGGWRGWRRTRSAFQTTEPTVLWTPAGMRGHQGQRDLKSVNEGLILRVLVLNRDRPCGSDLTFFVTAVCLRSWLYSFFFLKLLFIWLVVLQNVANFKLALSHLSRDPPIHLCAHCHWYRILHEATAQNFFSTHDVLLNNTI